MENRGRAFADATARRRRQMSETDFGENVAQIFNLPYRRFLICRSQESHPTLNPGLACRSGGLPIANRRYSRLKICATFVPSPKNLRCPRFPCIPSIPWFESAL